MKTPLIIVDVEAGDAMVFLSLDEAAGYMEPQDVDAGVYRAYDADGRLMNACTDGNKVWIEPAETPPPHEDDLRASLLLTLSESQVDITNVKGRTTLELIGILADRQRRRDNPLG